ncbi:MAG: type II toxin-antitoxin system Phd/YefM family antitoxin [Gammaproteobacteria bacterium]|nr:type II toxin-antitoxin system Phd/YefM family antitoxin [Gammaproteobacteria bacterium]
MSLRESVKPISYLKDNAAEIIRGFEKNRTPIIITQNGEAKAVFQDIQSYEEMREDLIMLQILMLGNADVEQGRTKPLKQAFAEHRKRLKEKYDK